MRKISVIGSGPAGCIFSYALMAKGYDVTMYSDRTPDQWLNHSQPTGTAYLWSNVIDIERELNMDHWSHEMFGGHGVLLDFCPKASFKPLTATGLFEGGREGSGIDQRMRVSRWLEDFESRGGKLVIEAVTPKRLDEIASKSDLTVVAAGKADLVNTMPRDDQRSVYNTAQRKLAMTFAKSKSGKHVRDWFTGRTGGFSAVKFDFFAEEGECFWVPYTHKDYGHVYCILWEAKEGTRMDKFDGAKGGKEILERGKQVIKDLCPWEHGILDDMEALDDPHGWQAGKFSPVVRQPYGVMPSGGLVMPIGDAAVTFDPIGGQGGNHASRNARHMAEEVFARGDKPFDAAWMTEINHNWWNDYAKYAYAFNNILLEPISVAGKTLLMEVARNKKFASEQFFAGFPNPKKFFPYFEDFAAARGLVRNAQSSASGNDIRDGLPIWTKLIKTEIAVKSVIAKNDYPAPGYKKSVMKDALQPAA